VLSYVSSVRRRSIETAGIVSGGRKIFEAKGLSDSNEISQCRAALAQLLEYRFFYGMDSDRLWLVVDRSIADRRRALLESNGVAVVFVTDSGQLQPIGQLATEMLSSRVT
jgi:hypothetical protein